MEEAPPRGPVDALCGPGLSLAEESEAWRRIYDTDSEGDLRAEGLAWYSASLLCGSGRKRSEGEDSWASIRPGSSTRIGVVEEDTGRLACVLCGKAKKRSEGEVLWVSAGLGGGLFREEEGVSWGFGLGEVGGCFLDGIVNACGCRSQDNSWQGDMQKPSAKLVYVHRGREREEWSEMLQDGIAREGCWVLYSSWEAL